MREWVSYLGKYIGGRVRVMVFNFTFNNISVIIWLSSGLLMEYQRKHKCKDKSLLNKIMCSLYLQSFIFDKSDFFSRPISTWPTQFKYVRDCRGRYRMIVGFTTIYGISAYHHWCCEFESRSGRGVQHYVT
jgi:hypothetical protein